MALPELDPIPYTEPLLNGKTLGERWYRWLSLLLARVLNATLSVARTQRSAAASAIATTTLFTPNLVGTYRASWAARISTPGTVSSSLTVTIGWKQGGIAQSHAFAAITGNTTTTTDSGTFDIRADPGTPITYETAYATVGATVMVYEIDVVVEHIA